jgi:TonB family protein
LLAIAGKRVEPDLAPATLFLRRRHLTQRVHYLLKDVAVSRLRLLLSYASIAAVLALAGWFTLAALPLTGSAQVKEAEAPDEPGVSVDTGGTILHRAAVPYPPAARSLGIGGTVVAELTLRKNGEVADARIASGPEELRAAVLWSVLQWHYVTDGQSLRTVQVTVDFTAPGPMPQAPGFEAPSNPGETNRTLADIDVRTLPEPLRSAVWAKVQAFQGQPFSYYLRQQVEKAASGLDSHLQFHWLPSRDGKDAALAIYLSHSFLPTPFYDQFSLERGASSETAKQFPSTGKPRVVVGAGVMQTKLLNKVEPVYPPLAQSARVIGTVVLDVLIAVDGRVASVTLSEGHPLLAPAAIDAVKQWTYKPITVGGKPVEVVTQVRVPFGTE